MTVHEYIGALLGCFVVAIIAVSGCYVFNASHVTCGTVVSKDFYPEHQESDTTYIQVGDDITVPITNWHTVPDKYTIGLTGEYKGKEYTRTVVVDKQSYLLIEVGQHLSIDDLPLIPTAEREMQ